MTMNDSFKPLVEPRAYSPDSLESLPLVDLVLLEQDTKHRTIRLVGRGIETALSWLQGELNDYSNILIVGADETVESPKQWDVVVYASSGEKARPRADLELKLTEWGEDEVIEYLMASSTPRCKSVMQRLEESDDLWLGGGSPRVLSIVLDQMIESDEVLSVGDGILRFFESIDFDFKTRRRVLDICLGNLFFDSRASIELFDSNITNADVISFLGNQTVRYVVATDKIVSMLEKRTAHKVMAAKWPLPFVRLIAAKVMRNAKANNFLNLLANTKDSKSAANAASLLVFNDRGWVPSIDEKHAYKNAKLSKVNWTGQSLKSASMSFVDMNQANLSKCDLENAKLIGGNFQNACFSGANLTLAYAARANFSQANMPAMSAHNSTFIESNLSAACLECSDLSKANFNESDLSHANLSNCNLTRTQFLDAKLWKVDFSNSRLSKAMLRSADLRTAKLTGAVLSRAAMQRCNLVNQQLDGVDMEYVMLNGALLTGTVFRNCNLRNAKLNNGKMADIDWEDCDLRDANFFNCHFLMGSTRAGTVDSPYPSHGTRTGFYTDDFDDHYFKSPEEIRKANLCRCNLLGAKVFAADFYLVDLRGAIYDDDQRVHFQKCGAILTD